MLSFRLSGAFLFRFATRRFSALLFHDPPRTTGRPLSTFPLTACQGCHTSEQISIPDAEFLQGETTLWRIRNRIPGMHETPHITRSRRNQLGVLFCCELGL